MVQNMTQKQFKIGLKKVPTMVSKWFNKGSKNGSKNGSSMV